QAQARPFGPTLNIAPKFLAFESGRLLIFVEPPVNSIRSAHQGVKRLLREDPLVGHIEAVNQLARLLDIDEVTDAFHIRLTSENPQISDENVVDDGGRRRSCDAHFDLIRTTGGNPLDVAIPAASLEFTNDLPIEARQHSAALFQYSRLNESRAG